MSTVGRQPSPGAPSVPAGGRNSQVIAWVSGSLSELELGGGRPGQVAGPVAVGGDLHEPVPPRESGLIASSPRCTSAPPILRSEPIAYLPRLSGFLTTWSTVIVAMPRRQNGLIHVVANRSASSRLLSSSPEAS